MADANPSPHFQKEDQEEEEEKGHDLNCYKNQLNFNILKCALKKTCFVKTTPQKNNCFIQNKTHAIKWYVVFILEEIIRDQQCNFMLFQSESSSIEFNEIYFQANLLKNQ